MAEIKIEPRGAFNSDLAPATSFVLFSTGAESKEEMLRISKDSFYVRGVKVEQDKQEARKVYEAFIDWMRGISIMK